ncbi:hypothetical protein [Winogradskyella psychrotolerans]|uniref:hypothetical protein n=1 Tax=Winogradskyella psychrotolerans TaxID=1344585 RepID=UPI001C07208E|nr:hypothetical protein [Winogradskyella psychrotolerans]MBU2927596.1 hypothetical protein [Winogradskyella psychrotolerans]
MNTNLLPTHSRLLGEHWVLWYDISNSYSVVTKEFKFVLEAYFKAKTKAEFFNILSSDFDDTDIDKLHQRISDYLQQCNILSTLPILKPTILEVTKRRVLKKYKFKDKTIQVYFSSESVSKIIHPALAQYYNTTSNVVDVTFDIHLKDEFLYLFKDEELISCVPMQEYHKTQGKFIMLLLCALHDKEEGDWIGTLHGSTITDGNSSILFVGKSGKGKSTLCALLAQNGLDLLADDVSPLLSEDQHLYYNPSAISIKAGAFNLLKPIVTNFNKLPIVEFNKTKGQLKYIPSLKPKKEHYPCGAIVSVNYQAESETKLEQISAKLILETLIEDSWLSPKSKHAEQFLNWLETKQLYQITYSNTNSVTSEIKKLFKLHQNA